MTAFDSSSCINRRQDLMVSDLSPTEAVMMDIDLGLYFGLDNVAKDIWDYLSAPHTLAELYEYLAVRYDVDPDTLTADTLAFLSQMQEKGLITVS